MEATSIWLLSFEKCREDILGGHFILRTGGVDLNTNRLSFLLEDLLWVVVFFKRVIYAVILKLFLMLLQFLHPAARETAVRVDLKHSLILRIHLVDYIL